MRAGFLPSSAISTKWTRSASDPQRFGLQGGNARRDDGNEHRLPALDVRPVMNGTTASKKALLSPVQQRLVTVAPVCLTQLRRSSSLSLHAP